MRLFIAAGGVGRRLGQGAVKSLVPVGGVPIIDRIIAAGRASGFDGITVGVDDHKEALVAHLDGQCSIQHGCHEPLLRSFMAAARDADDDIIVGVNGDTLWYPESATWMTDRFRDRPHIDAAVLLTTVCTPYPHPEVRYWRYRVGAYDRVEALDDVPCPEIDTQFIMLACRRAALEALSAGWSRDFSDWRSLPFHCRSFGWDYLVRLMLWQGMAVDGYRGDDLCLNINTPEDLVRAELFYRDPAEFRYRSLVPEGAERPERIEHTLIRYPVTVDATAALVQLSQFGLRIDEVWEQTQPDGIRIRCVLASGRGAFVQAVRWKDAVALDSVRVTFSRWSFERQLLSELALYRP